MASSLIIENGTIVANANSYVTLTEARAYALARGVTLLNTDALDVDAIKAMDYLEAQRARYQGYKVSELQSLQWPRSSVYIDNIAIAETAIPVELKNAQMRLMMEIKAGVDLFPTKTGQTVKSETVGPISTTYSDDGSITPFLSAIDAMLEPLFGSSVGFLTTVRV